MASQPRSGAAALVAMFYGYTAVRSFISACCIQPRFLSILAFPDLSCEGFAYDLRAIATNSVVDVGVLLKGEP